MTTTTERIQLNRKTAAQWTAANTVLLAGEAGVELDTGKVKFGNGTSGWTALPYSYAGAAGVTTVNSRSGDVVVTKTDVGLGNVDNTSDANKPVSTAQATALAAKITRPAGGVAAQYLGNDGAGGQAWMSIPAAGGGGGTGGSGEEVSLAAYLPTGYVTDGSTAYDTAWTNLLAGNSSVYIPEGTWLLNTAHTIPNTVASIRLHPNAVVLSSVTTGSPFIRTGTVASTSTAITAGGTTGSTSITVASAAGITVGSWLYITSDDPIPNLSTTFIAFLRRVDAVSGTTVTLDTPFFRTMTTSPRAYVASLAPALTLRGGRWSHTNPTAVTGTKPFWQFQLCQGPITTDMTIQYHGSSAMQLANCVGGTARNLNVFDCIDDAAGSHFGYGIAWVGATRDHVWESGLGARIRHGVTTGGTTISVGGSTQRGEPDTCKVLAGVTVSDGINAAFDSHEPGFNIQFLGPTAINTLIGGQTRSDQSIIDVVVVSPRLFGIQVINTATDAFVSIKLWNPTSGGSAVIRNTGTATRVGPSTAIGLPSGWVGINSDTAYVVQGPGRIDGGRTGAGTVSVASLDMTGA